MRTKRILEGLSRAAISANALDHISTFKRKFSLCVQRLRTRFVGAEPAQDPLARPWTIGRVVDIDPMQEDAVVEYNNFSFRPAM